MFIFNCLVVYFLRFLLYKLLNANRFVYITEMEANDKIRIISCNLIQFHSVLIEVCRCMYSFSKTTNQSARQIMTALRIFTTTICPSPTVTSVDSVTSLSILHSLFKPPYHGNWELRHGLSTFKSAACIT